MKVEEETGIIGAIKFNFGIYFDHPTHYRMYYSGLFFKLVVHREI